MTPLPIVLAIAAAYGLTPYGPAIPSAVYIDCFSPKWHQRAKWGRA